MLFRSPEMLWLADLDAFEEAYGKFGAARAAAAAEAAAASGGAVVAKTGQFGAYVSDGFVNATIPKDEPIDELSNDRAYELLAIRREKLGLEPGQAPAKTSKAGARKSAPARTVKRGATRKSK